MTARRKAGGSGEARAVGQPAGLGGAWARALALAGRTPAERNRYVDFLRAASILLVVVGHWLVAAPHVEGGSARLDHMLALAPWTRWLTWLVQVMPTFFLVGGFANAISWQSARSRGESYAAWLHGRTRRLIAPIVPLLLVWIALAAAARRFDLSPEVVRTGSQVALVPTWFLAVYLGVVLLVPATWAAWRRWSWLSLALPAAAALAVDVAAFRFGAGALRWLNYACVWVAVHQLGYAWQTGRLGGWKRRLLWAGGGFLALAAALLLGPYSVSMVGVPGEEISNTLPPTVALLAFAVAQLGLVLALESPARRWLDGARPWAATVLINARIMTLYLWHSTVLVLVIGALVAAGGVALHLQPGSVPWWAARPLWLAALAALLWPLLALLGRFERPGHGGPAPPAWRLVGGAALLCGGIGLLALDGIAAANPLGVRPVVLLPLAGAALAAVGALTGKGRPPAAGLAPSPPAP